MFKSGGGAGLAQMLSATRVVVEFSELSVVHAVPGSIATSQ